MNKNIKKALSLLLAVLTVISVFGISSFGASESYGKKYGFVKTVKSDYKTKCTSYSFKKDSGKIYLFFDAAKSLSDKTRKTVYYGFALYKDSKYKSAVADITGAFPKKDGKAAVPINMASLKSGVYYGKVYTFIKKSDGTKVTDSDSVGKFTITVNKIGSSAPELNGVTFSVKGNRISWNSLKYASVYRVYRKLYGESTWKKLCDVTTTSYTDNTMEHGLKYVYTVKAFDGSYTSLYNKSGVTAVYLDAPELMKPVTGDDNSVSVNWSSVSGAEKYYIYKRTENETSYKRVKTVGKNVASFTDNSKKTDGETLYYKVRAVNGISAGLLSNTVKTSPFLSVKSTAFYKDGAVTVSWNEYGDKYYLYKKDGSGDWNLIFEGNDISYIDTDVVPDMTYCYSLVAEKDGKKSSFDTKGFTFTTLGETKIKSVVNSVDNSVLIKWNKKAGATGYEIYRKADGSEFEKIGVTGDTSSFYDITEKKNNLRYSYTVKAFGKYADGTMNTQGVSHLYMEAPVNVSAEAVKNGGNKISWNEVKGAISYNVYRKAPGGDWSLLGNTTTSEYTDSKVKSNSKYYYAVKALNGAVEGCFMSGFGVNCLNAPVLVSLKKSGTSLKLSWQSVTGANGYYIYRKEEGGSFKKIATVGALSYTDKTAKESGKKYIYTVKAYNDGGVGLYDIFGLSADF